MSTGAIIAIVVVVVLLVAAAVFLLMPQMRSQRLRRRFGPEYDHVVSHNGDDRRAAEKELADRERRHSEFELHPIPPENREKYQSEWNRVQEQFVDQPVEAVKQADRLVNVVVSDLGYPSEGYDRQLADLSVRHAHSVEHYRSAHDTRVREDASTDDLRTALISYRKVFNELLDNGVDNRNTKQDKTEAVQRG